MPPPPMMMAPAPVRHVRGLVELGSIVDGTAIHGRGRAGLDAGETETQSHRGSDDD